MNKYEELFELVQKLYTETDLRMNDQNNLLRLSFELTNKKYTFMFDNKKQKILVFTYLGLEHNGYLSFVCNETKDTLLIKDITNLYEGCKLTIYKDQVKEEQEESLYDIFNQMFKEEKRA